MFSKILFVSSTSDTDHNALTSALNFAHKVNAALEVFVCLPDIPETLSHYKKDFKEALRSNNQQKLDLALEQANLTHANITLSLSFSAESNAALAVAEKVTREDFNLVIKEKILKSSFFDIFSTDMSLAKKCPCSLLFLRPDKILSQTPKHFTAAISTQLNQTLENSMAEQVAKIGAALANDFGSRLTLVSCYTDALISMLNTFSHGEIAERDREAWEHEVQNTNEANLLRLAKLSGIENPDTRQIMGNPEDVLVEFSNAKNIDLLLVGASNKSEFANFLLGSTTEELIRNLPCALLLVKPIQSSKPR